MTHSKEPSDDDDFLGCFLIVCALLFVGLMVFIFAVVVPDGRGQIERCEAANGVMLKGGACVKKDSLVGY